MQEKLDLAKELIQQSRRLLYTTKEIMAVLDSNERILNSLLAGLESAVPVDVEYDWSAFPEWVNFAATDEDGAVWAYELNPPEPDEDNERWCPDWSGKAVRIVHPIGKGHCPHWQSTLRQRPVKPELDVWALVPDNARFIAKDANGEWYSYARRPKCNNSDVWYSGGDFHMIDDCPLYCDNWKQSLIERPQQAPNVGDNAPSWAKWLAMDKNGEWNWYSHKPDHERGQWWHPIIPMASPVHAPFEDCPLTCDNWKTSLVERPRGDDKREDIWSRVPDYVEGAKFVAMDMCGEWYWYTHKPELHATRWLAPRGKGSDFGSLPYDIPADDWTKSLQERPNA